MEGAGHESEHNVLFNRIAAGKLKKLAATEYGVIGLVRFLVDLQRVAHGQLPFTRLGVRSPGSPGSGNHDMEIIAII